ncbi:MAG: hypothetical protein AAGE43_12445 [Pseudomonadota bacterium]
MLGQTRILNWQPIDWRTCGAKLANGNWLHLTSLSGGDYELNEIACDSSGWSLCVRDYGYFGSRDAANDQAAAIARRRDWVWA